MSTHVTRNIDARRAQLGIKTKHLEEATGIPRQTIYRVKENPETTSIRQLNRIAKMLFCPVAALMSEDPAVPASYPIPPSTWLETIRSNRGRFGFEGDDGSVTFAEFVDEVIRDHAARTKTEVTDASLATDND